MGAEGRADAQEKPSGGSGARAPSRRHSGPQERPSEPGDPPGSKSQPAVSQDDGSERCAVSMLSHTVL